MKKISTFIFILFCFFGNAQTVSFVGIPETCPGDNDAFIDINITSGIAAPFEWDLQLDIAASGLPPQYVSVDQGASNTLTFTIPLGFNQSGDFCITFYAFGDLFGTPIGQSCGNVPQIVPVAVIPAMTTKVDPTCAGFSDGSATLDPVGGTAPYSYLWSDGQTTQTAIGLSDGTYTYTVTDANSCQPPATGTVTITDPNAVTAVINAIDVSDVTCFGDNDGSATVTPGGGVGTPYTYLWSDGQITQTATGLSDGTYSCEVFDANLCPVTSNTITISEPAVLTASPATITDITCNGANDGTATVVNPQGGTTPYSYLWSDGQTTQTATGLSVGTYDCIITDNNSCQFTTSPVTISEPAVLTADPTTGTDITCNGFNNGTATVVNPQGGTTPYSYLWSNGQISNPATGLSAGTYDCVITDANACTFTTSSVTIIEPTAISAGVPLTTDITCNGFNDGTATVVNPQGGAGGYTYLWNPGGQASQIATGLSAGTYDCLITDADGCTFTTNPVTINEPAAVSIQLIDITQVDCNGGASGAINVTVAGGSGTGTYSYSWSADPLTGADLGSNAPNVEDLIDLVTGDYSLSVSDANGCIPTPNPTVITVVQDPALVVVTPTPSLVSCTGGSDGIATVTVTGGTGLGTYTYEWQDAGGNPVSANASTGPILTAGDYTVIVTDDFGFGCSQTNTVTVSEPATLLTVPVTNITNVSCFGGSDGVVEVFPTGGVVPYTYSWSNGSTVFSTGFVSQGTYICDILDAAGCTEQVVVVVDQPDQIGFLSAMQVNDPTCPLFTDGDATVVPTGGTQPYSYSWIPGGQTTASLASIGAGTYTCVIIDANGCSPPSASITGTLIDPPTISWSVTDQTDVLCTGDATGSIELVVSGGTQFSAPADPYTFEWTPPNGPALPPIIGTSTNSSLLAGTYSCQITDANSCIVNTGPITISEPNTALSLSVTNVVNETCFGFSDGQVEVTPIGGTPPYSYAWSNSAPNSNIATGLIGGAYTCIVTDANGCQATADTTVISAIDLTVTIPSVLPPSCNSTTIGISNDGTATVSVSGGTGLGTYSYLWDDPLSQTTATASGLTTGIYTCQIVDANNCNTSATVFVPEPSPDITATFNTIDVDCFGESTGQIIMSVAGGTPAYTYDWISTGETTSTIQNLSAGTYICNVSDVTGCITVLSTTVNQNPELTLDNFNLIQMSATGANDGSIDVSVSGGIGLYSYSWTDINSGLPVPATQGGLTPSINQLWPSTYEVTVTDVAGCDTTFTFSIPDPGCALVVTDNAPVVDCFGGTTAVSWSNSNGVPPYTNTLIDPNGVPVDLVAIFGTNQFATPNPSIPLNLPGGVYQLTVEDAAGCYGNNLFNININVVEPAELALSLTVTDVACHGDNSGAVSATVTGGVLPYTQGLIVTSTGNPISQNQLAAGNYSYTVIDANGCIADTIFPISQPSAPLSFTSSATAQGCTSLDGTATVNVTGGTPGYSYSWATLPIQTTQTASNLAFGSYTCNITDVNLCSITAQVTVPVVDPLTLSISSNNPSCNGFNDGSISTSIVSGTLPISYIWEDLANPGVTLSTSDMILGLSTGIYSLSATDASGCTFTPPAIAITEPGSITFSQNAVMPTLNGACDGSITVTNILGGDGNYSYTWIGPNGFTSTNANLPPPLCAGTYQLTITDGNGCVGTQSANIIDPSCNISVPFVFTQPACNGLTGDLSYGPISGGQAPYLIEVYEYGTNFQMYSGNSITSTTPISLPDGQYYMTVEDNLGCSHQIINITVVEPLLLTAFVQTDSVTCNGFSDGVGLAIVSGGNNSSYNYLWSGNLSNNTPINTGLNAGSYNLVVTDANGCTSSPAFYDILEPALLSVSTPIFTEPSCNGNGDATAVASITGGTTPYTYLWSPSGDITNPAIGNPPSIGIFAGGNSLQVTDDNGCIATNSVTITEPASLTVTFTTSGAICDGASNGTISATVSGGVAPYSYLWSDGQTTQTATGLSAGNYTCTVTDSEGCINTFSQTITSASPIVLNLTITNVSCNGLSDGAASVLPSGGTPAYSYAWSNGGTNASIPNLAIGVYSVQVTDASGCIEDSVFAISQPSSIIASSNTDSTSCYGYSDGSMTVNATGGALSYTYTLEDAFGSILGVSTSGTFTALSAGIYTCVIDDGFCNVVTISDTVLEPDAIVDNAVITPISCFGGNNGSISISPTGENDDFTYFWSNLGSTSTSVSALQPFTYNVTITPTNGCDAVTFTYNMANYQPAVVSLTVTPSFYDYNSDGIGTEISCFDSTDGWAVVNPTGGTAPYTYLWDDPSGQTNDTAFGLSQGTYTVNVTDHNGCSEVISVTLNQPNAVLSNLLVIDNSCFGANDGNATVIPSGVTGTNYDVEWNGISSGTVTFFAFNPGFNTVQVINTMTNCPSGVEVFEIVEPAELIATEVVTNVLCHGAATGVISVTAIDGTSPYSYSWSNGQTGATATGLSQGIYSYTVTDANGCIFTNNNVTITEPLSIDTNFIYTDVSCNGGNDGQVTVVVNGGVGPYTYSWPSDPLNTSNTSGGYQSGSYSVIITDANGCAPVFVFDIDEPTPFTMSASVSSNYNGEDISCNGASDGEITLTSNGGNGIDYYNINGLILPGPNNVVQGGWPADTYFIEAYDLNGCNTSTSVTITEPTPVSSNIIITNISCNGVADGVIAVNPSGGTVAGLYNVDWFNVGSVPSTYHGYSTDPVYPLDTFSNGLVIVEDDNGCTDTNFVEITQPANSLTVTTSSTSPTCNVADNGPGSSTNGTATVFVSPTSGTAPYTYDWFDITTGFSVPIGQITSTADNLSAGNYECVITDANGCNITSTVDVIASAPLDAGLVTTPVTCLGFADGTATINPSGGGGLYAISWSNGFTGVTTQTQLPPFDPLNALTVTITDINPATNCGDIIVPVVIGTPNSPLTAFVSANNITPPSCFGINDGSIILSGSGGSSPYTYAFPSLGIPVNSALYLPASPAIMGAGIYPAIVIDANGCMDTLAFDMSVYAPDQINPNVASVFNWNGFDIECNGQSNGAIESNPTGGTVVLPTDYTYNWIDANGLNVGTQAVVPNVPAGIYTVTVTDNNACSESTSITLVEPPAVGISFVPSIYNGFNISCAGGNDGTLGATFTGGANGVDMSSYVWSNSVSAIISNNPTASLLVLDTYTLTISDNNGCVFSDTYTMLEPPLLTTTVSVVSTVCDGSIDGSATANPIGGTGLGTYSYLWTGGQITQTATGLQGNNSIYNVTVTDANGCQASTSATITSPAPIIVSVDPNNVVMPSCNGYNDGSIFGIVTAPVVASGYSYSVDGSSFGPLQPTYGTLDAGPVVIIAQDINGCTGIETVNLIDPPVLDPGLFVTSYPSCGGPLDNSGVVIASPNGTPNYNFQWVDNATGITLLNELNVAVSTLANIPVGQYDVTVTETGIAGCIGQGSVILTPASTLAINFTTVDVTCTNGNNGSATASLNPPNIAVSYLWDDPNATTTPTVNNLAAGTYSVTITNQLGCESTESITIIEPSTNLAIQTQSWDLNCFQDASGQAQVLINTSSPGTPFPIGDPYIYTWNTVPPTQVWTTSAIQGLDVGTYEVSVEDATGCIQTAQVIINQPPLLEVTVVSSTDISCNGVGDGEIVAVATGGTPIYSYVWNGPLGTFPGNTNANISNLNSGTYVLNVSDINGCQAMGSSVVINEPMLLNASSVVTSDYEGFGVQCNGESNGTVEITVNGGISPYNINYNSLVLTGITNPITSISNLSAGSHGFLITDANGCTYTGYETITEPTALSVASIVIEHPSCFGENDGSAAITVTGGVPDLIAGAPQYNFEDLTGVAVDLSALSDGLYNVVISDMNDCEVPLDFFIVEPLEILVTEQVCLNSMTIDVENALGNYAITWKDDAGALVGTGLTISDLEDGNYHLLIIDQPNGCTYENSFYLGLPSIVAENATCNTSDDGSIEVAISGNSFYDVWMNGSQIADDALLASAYDLPVGAYNINIIDEEGNCDYSKIITVGFEGGYSCVDPPIIISPNSDGVNDTWIPAADVNEDISVTIYNRWGQIEFYSETNSSLFEWDGTGNNGETLASTDYYFVVRFINAESMADKTGIITLIR